MQCRTLLGETPRTVRLAGRTLFYADFTNSSPRPSPCFVNFPRPVLCLRGAMRLITVDLSLLFCVFPFLKIS